LLSVEAAAARLITVPEVVAAAAIFSTAAIVAVSPYLHRLFLA
jgi:hypothetical protein